MEINWFNREKYFFTDESVKGQITDSISENLTDSDLESSEIKAGHWFISWYIFTDIISDYFTDSGLESMLIIIKEV